MNLHIKIEGGEQSLLLWLAKRIQDDVREKYGLEIKVELNIPPDNQITVDATQNRHKSEQVKVNSWAHLPDVLSPNDIQKALRIGRVQTYNLLNDPPFHVKRIGRKFYVSKDVFLEWFEGNNR